MKQPATVIIAVSVAFFLASWHGLLGLTGGISQLRYIFGPFSLMMEGYFDWALIDLAQIITSIVAGLARVLGALLLCVGAVQLLRARGRAPLVAGAVLVILGHAVAWGIASFFAVYHHGASEYELMMWMEESWLPYFLLDMVYTFGFLITPLSILGNAGLVALSALLALTMVGTAFAPPTSAWIAAASAPADPSPESPVETSGPSETPSMTDDESTIPEGDIPPITDPDAEATEMVSGEEVEAMLSQAAEEAAAKRDA